MAFPAGLNVPGRTLIMLTGGGVPVLLPAGGSALAGDSDVPVLLFVGLAKTQPDTQ